MEEKLTKQDMQFMILLYIIWQMAKEYADKLSIKVPSDPTKMNVNIYYIDDITHIRCKFKKKNTQDEHSSAVADNTLNEYLKIEMQGKYKQIEDSEDSIEGLFINEINESGTNKDKIDLDIIYIDNETAYEYVKEVQRKRMELLSEED